MKKIILLSLMVGILIAGLFVLTGCGNNGVDQSKSSSTNENGMTKYIATKKTDYSDYTKCKSEIEFVYEFDRNDKLITMTQTYRYIYNENDDEKYKEDIEKYKGYADTDKKDNGVEKTLNYDDSDMTITRIWQYDIANLDDTVRQNYKYLRDDNTCDLKLLKSTLEKNGYELNF